MSGKWKWAEDGSSVEVDGKPFRFLSPEAEILEEYGKRLTLDKSVFLGLMRAKANIVGGGAVSYENAAANLRELLVELDLAESTLSKTAREFSGFFDPPTIHQAIGEAQGLMHFIQETFSRMVKANGG